MSNLALFLDHLKQAVQETIHILHLTKVKQQVISEQQQKNHDLVFQRITKNYYMYLLFQNEKGVNTM